MSHIHEHSHSDPGAMIKRLWWAIVLTFVIFLAEAIGGYLSNSLALLSDAGHLFADVFALVLSLVALYLTRLPSTSKHTYGYHRAEVMAAVINGITLFIIAGVIFYEAYRRIFHPEPVKTVAMLIVAAIGLVANLVIAISLHRSAGGNLNIKAAYFHVIGDLLASVGVIAGAVIMMITGNYLADPIISVVVGLIILRGAYGVIKEGTSILLESVPAQIDYEALKRDLLNTEGVQGIHDLHVWTLSSSKIMLSVHVYIDSTESHIGSEILKRLNDMLREKYDIRHSTIQFECNCCQIPSENTCVVGDSRDSFDDDI
jgi:cobalt-zinc-cadmium efflux system protein